MRKARIYAGLEHIIGYGCMVDDTSITYSVFLPIKKVFLSDLLLLN